MNNKEGILLVNKPIGLTSRDVVNIISKELNTKKVGHTGTLDKDASGVLVILIGKYTKLTEYLTSTYKEYIASFSLGYETDTLDKTGKVIKKSNTKKSIDEIEKMIYSFKGEYMQEVPLYSAVHVNGKRLYKYALEKETVDIPKRLVNIKNIEILSITTNDIKVKFLVSKGTYIRSLVRDIGRKLNTYATLTNLVRTKQGTFNIDNAYTIDEIKNNKYKLLNVYDILDSSCFIDISIDKYKEVINGVKQKENTNKEIICYTYNSSIVALYKKSESVYKMYIKF